MRPEDILPDHLDATRVAGTLVRKGTVAAFLANARIVAAPGSTPAQRAEAERDIAESLPALHALGLFEVLAVRDARVRALVEAWPRP